MINSKLKTATFRTALFASVAALSLSAITPFVTDYDVAFAAGGSGKQAKGGAGGAGGHGQGGAGQGGAGKGKSLHGIFRDLTGSDDGDDSDAPDWAGQKGGKSGMGGGKPASAGAKKGDLFGDLWVILRDANGVPILSPEGFTQPLDANGNLIPLDEEGHPVDETLTVEVELGRLNVGRAPSKVLDRRADEVIALLNAATAVSLDAAGRLVLTVDGEEKTIDSPLENLAIYTALMTTGTIPGVTDLPGDAYDFLVDGVLTAKDVQASAAFLAGASDKTGVLTTDEIAYINTFLDINVEKSGSVSYSVVDYSGVSYDRSDSFGSVTTTVLVQQPDGSWVAQDVNVYDVVFGGVDYTGSGSLDAYTQAADDAREVIEFIHEYEVPMDTTTIN